MRNVVLLVTLIALAPAGAVHAQQLRIEFADGRVTIKAENTPLRTILAEWARQGGTRMVNAERVTSAPVTLDLTNAPERQALDILLRGVAGYMIGLGDTAAAGPPTRGRSIFDRVHILPTPATTPAASPAPQARPGRLPVAVRPVEVEPDPDVELDSDVQAPPSDQLGPQTSRPTPAGAPTPARSLDTDTDAAPPTSQPPRSTPFGTVTGASRPGVIVPAQQPPPRAQPPRE